jgi:hypothetical protein
MFDGCHFIGGDGLVDKELFYKSWDPMIEAQHDALVTGKHVSVSTFPRDGYPVHLMSDEMFCELGDGYSPEMRTVVVENQQKDHVFWLSRKATLGVQRRNGIIFGKLHKGNVVRFQ